MSYFVFNDVDSRTYGTLEQSLFTAPPVTEINTFVIPNRPESAFIPKIEMGNITISRTLGLKSKEKLREIYAWLQGSGKLILSDELDKYYNVVNVNISNTYAGTRFIKLNISFTCMPLVYSVENPVIRLTTSPSLLNVDGTYYCEPVYELSFKSGISPQTTNFAVNGQIVTINLTEEHIKHKIILDSRVQKIYYKDTGELILPDTVGLIPYLNYGGNNKIEFDSNVIDYVDVAKNERWR